MGLTMAALVLPFPLPTPHASAVATSENSFLPLEVGAAAGLPSYHNEEGNLIIYQRIIQLPMVESHNSLVVSLGTVLKAIVTIKYLYDQKILK